MNLFCWTPSVDIFNILPGFLWQPLLRSKKEIFRTVKCSFSLVTLFFAVQKRPREWLVWTSRVRHIHQRVRLSLRRWHNMVAGRNSGVFVDNNKLRVVTCRGDRNVYSALSTWAWVLFQWRRAKKNPWIQERKKFRNFKLRALKVAGRILLGVFVKDV